MSTHETGRKPERGRPYVDRVLGETQQYTHELLAENEHLRVVMTSLEDERQRLLERNSLLEGIERENQTLQDLLASIERERSRLEGQLKALREEGRRQALEQLRLREELAAFEARSQRFARQFETIERQNSSLANLYAATYQLHESLDREQVLVSIQEILANLVGSEQTAVFEVAEGGAALCASACNGVDERRYSRIELGRGVLGRAAATGERQLFGPGGDAERPEDEPALTACVPLTLGGALIGLIAVWSLLPQKPALGDLDRELFALLATHAATALHCARLQERVGPLTVQP